MDVIWIAPLVATFAALGGLLVAGRTARRATAELGADRPALTTLGEDVRALHGELAGLRERVERRRAASGGPTGDR